MVRFVSEDYINKKSLISANMDFAIIGPILDLVQFKYIKKYLGSDLYDAIADHITAYQASATAIPAAYKTLLDDYIRPCIIQHLQAELIVPSKFRFEPKGVVENSGDNSNPISASDIESVVDSFRNNGEAYGQEMIKYILQQGASVFPERYTNTGIDKTQPQTDAFDSPFYFPQRANVKPYPNYNE